MVAHECRQRASQPFAAFVGPYAAAVKPNLAFFEVGGVWLMLSPAEQPEFDHPASILYFDVDDIGAVHAALKQRGASFRSEPHVVHRDGARALWLADFYDSEQNTYALRQWRTA